MTGYNCSPQHSLKHLRVYIFAIYCLSLRITDWRRAVSHGRGLVVTVERRYGGPSAPAGYSDMPQVRTHLPGF